MSELTCRRYPPMTPASHPPMDYPGYRSTALRHPKQPLHRCCRSG